MLQVICRSGPEEVVEPILEFRFFAEGNSLQIVGENAEEVVIRRGKVRRVGWMWKNLSVEFLNGCFHHVCSVWSGVVMLKNHSMSSTWALSLDCYLQTAKLLTIALSSDGQVLLKQFIMDSPPPYPTRYRPKRRVSLMSTVPCLKCTNHFWAVLSAIVSSP
jgi:hypothetical protein